MIRLTSHRNAATTRICISRLSCWRRSQALHRASPPRRNKTRPPRRKRGTEIAPRGQREVKDVAYGDWRKLCFKPGGAKMICRTSITGKFATGQMAVRSISSSVKATAMHGCRCSPPSACICRNRSCLRSIKGEPHPVPYTWCLTNTCIAGDRGRPEDDPGNGFGTDAAAGIRRIQTCWHSRRRFRLPSSPPSTRARRHRRSSRTSMNEETDRARILPYELSRPPR